MENKKALSISPKLIIYFILILVIIILVILGIKMYNSNKNKDISTEPITLSNSKIEQNFPFVFLQIENDGKNILYSPLSIKYALNMLNEGANNNTKTQIENVIKNLNLTNYKDIDNVLSLANAVYIRNSFSNNVRSSFITTLKNRYEAEVKYDNFESAKNINNWIEDRTLGIIKNMVDDEIIKDPLAKMLLINALAIDMDWAHEFDASKTYKDKFYLDNGEEKFLETMHEDISNNTASYYKNKDLTVLTMDLKKYEDVQLEFMAIMPDKNLNEYINNFSINELENITKNLTPASQLKGGIRISIPKFSYEHELELKKDLMTLGITDAFKESIADFNNISDKELFVKEALHRANIEFKENGIKAAAATVIIMYSESATINNNKPLEITINKPFLYLIRDKNTDEIWFVGSMYEPTFEK